MRRDEVLEAARECVCQNRQDQYGNPESSFRRTAKMWSAYKGVTFSPEDVAAMMLLLKVSRIAECPAHMDNWIDAAGYAANGGEVASGHDRIYIVPAGTEVIEP